MNADGHGLSLDSNPIPGSPGAALDDDFQDPNGLRTEAEKRNIFAETTILPACSTEMTEGTGRTPGFTYSASSVVMSTSVLRLTGPLDLDGVGNYADPVLQ